MALTTLDPKTALVVIDLQKGLLGMQTAHPFDEVVGQAAHLASAFRRRGLPVVLVNVTGGAPGRTEMPRHVLPTDPAFAEILDELQPQADDVRVTKRTWGAFHETALHDVLQARGVTQIVLAGVATSAGVESTARAAHEHGYNVALATDAMTDRSIEAHENSIERIFPKLGETATTAELLAMLEEAP